MMTQTYNPRTWIVTGRGSEVEAVKSQVHTKFKANLGYMAMHQKKKKKEEALTAAIEVNWVCPSDQLRKNKEKDKAFGLWPLDRTAQTKTQYQDPVCAMEK